MRWFNRRREAADQERRLARILIETGAELPVTSTMKLPGDVAALRGIPVVGGRGIGGAIAGTRPEVEALRERR